MKIEMEERLFTHVMYIAIIIMLIIFVTQRQSVLHKWEQRAFKTLELYQDVCKKYNEYPKYIP